MTLNVEVLVEALRHTYNPDKATRQAAEAHIAQAQTQPGYLVLLLQITVREGTVREIQQAAGIQLKNAILRNWRTGERRKTANSKKSAGLIVLDISDNDRGVIRSNLVEALSRANDSTLRKLLSECIGCICREDFPERWPELLDVLLKHLNTGEYNAMHAALMALQKVCAKYTMKKKTERKPLHTVIENSFPLLMQLSQTLINHDSPEAAEMLKLICKIYFKCVDFHLPPYLKQPPIVLAWTELFRQVLEKPLPVQAPSGSTVEEWPWWKAKKYSARTMERMFQRYGIQEFAPEEDMDFAKLFSVGDSCIALKFVPTMLRILESKKRGEFCTPGVFRSAIMFVETGCQLSVTFKAINQHLQFLISDVLIPTMAWSQEDLQVWQEDPVQLVRDKFSFGFYMNIGSNPEEAAAVLLEELCFTRTRYALTITLNAIGDSISNYESCIDLYIRRNQQSFEHALMKTGAIRGLGALSKILKDNPGYRTQLEGIIVNNILPELNSPFPVMRLTACKCMGKFLRISWTSTQNETIVAQSMLRLLQDPDLPVRVQAACVLGTLFKHGTHTMLKVTNGSLSEVVQGYLSLLREIAVDDVFEAMQVLIDRFSSKMAHMTKDLCRNLSEAFLRFYNEESKEDEEFNETSMVAVDCIQAINQLLIAVGEGENSIEATRDVVPVVLPAIHVVFTGSSGDTMDYLQSVLETIRIVTFHGKYVPTELWQYVPIIFKIFNEWAQDYIIEFCGTLENMIQYDPRAFLSVSNGEQSNLQLVLRLAEIGLESDEVREDEKAYAVILLQVVVQSCIGSIDDVVKSLISLALKHLQTASETPYIVNLLCLIESAMFYNPRLALDCLGNNTPVIFKTFFDNIEYHYAQAEQKIALFAICSIFRLSPEEMPQSVQIILPQLLHKLSGLFKSLQEIKQSVLEHQQNKAKENKLIDEFGYKSANSDDEDDNAKYAPQRKKDVPLEQDATSSYGNDDQLTSTEEAALDNVIDKAIEWDEESDLLDGDEEEDESPLDSIDEFSFLNQVISGGTEQTKQAFSQALKALQAEDRLVIEQAFMEGQRRAAGGTA